MRTSRKWLSQYVDIDDLTMQELADKITAAGLEVEGCEPMSSGSNLVIGEVLTCQPHPDSDHLNVTTVHVGDETLQIVCGAPNVAAGQKVIVAKAGARLPGGEIKKGMIRNVESNGMICALFELGVDPHLLTEEQKAGIEVLPADAPVGHTDPLGYLGYDDEIFEIGLTPNRSDCQAQFNLGMEVGAILDREVVLPNFENASVCGKDTDLKIESETEQCPLFLGKVIGSITIKESPRWMKELLQAAGMHSINNVVDISNIVMLETGQPMHFYDIDAIRNQEITVKNGFNEDYVALDGETYHLLPEDIVITNEGKPIGIAGIMGGDDSKILDSTRGLIIECASFDHVSIRNTARRLNLSTESSLRYQRGIEPMAPKKAMDRAVQLLIQYADAKEIGETVQCGELRDPQTVLSCTAEEINNRLGTDFSCEEIVSVFDRLLFAPIVQDGVITVTIPSHRTDMEGMADLSEEVIRILGYDRLPSTLPYMPMTEGKLNKKQSLIRMTENLLCDQGLQQCVTYTLISTAKKDDAVLACGEAIELASPMSEERRWVRTSILPSLIGVAAYNEAHGNKNTALFEISELSSREGTQNHLAVVLDGVLEQTRWLHESVPADFYTLKGLLEAYLEKIGVNANTILLKPNTKDTTHFHPYRSAELYLGKKMVGLLGEIHPVYAKANDVKRLCIAELDLDAILQVKKSKVKFSAISRYPSVSRDLAFVVERSLPAKKIMETIKRHGRDPQTKETILKNVEVFDIYEGEHVAENEKSVAISITFQSSRQTLTDAQMNQVFDSILEALEKECHAVLRK